MTEKNTYHIITYGCQMNKSDSERLAAVFEHAGYVATTRKKADIILINACSVRQSAIDRIWGLLESYEPRRLSGALKTIITGCILPEDREAFRGRFDLVFDIKNIAELEKFLQNTSPSTDDYFDVKPHYAHAYQAFVPIMTGCNNFCSYCAVPYVRGPEQSRSVCSVITEITNLAQSGCREIHLLGQNVNSYAPEDQESFDQHNPFKHNFAKLLWEINNISGIERLTFSSAHPKDMSDDVIAALALPKMLNYLHLALQSGDNEILKKMNRQYTVEDYYKIVEKIRAVRPEIALGTDIIVGFPGETEEQFERTVAFYKKVNFDIVYHAQYSPRSGTVAASLPDDVSAEEKKRCWDKLQSVMEEQTFNINQRYRDRTVSVLFDSCGDGYCDGQSREMKLVRYYTAENLVGQIREVRIREPKRWILEG